MRAKDAVQVVTNRFKAQLGFTSTVSEAQAPTPHKFYWSAAEDGLEPIPNGEKYHDDERYGIK